MRATLKPHPDTPAPAIGIEAEADRREGRLWLTYRLTGDLGALRISPPAPPARTDELWKHTCFEAFVAPVAGHAYCEINLSPSGQWAIYRFTGYRSGMAAAAVKAPPWSESQMAERELTLRAQIELDGSPEFAAAWRLGLTAVIEDAGGSLSYWS